MPAGWKEPRAVGPAPIPGSRGRLRSSHSWACKRHIPVPGSGRAPATQPSLTARRRRPPWSCPLAPPPTGPRGSPLSSEGGKPGPLSASEAFQTRPGPLVINENLNILLPGWSQGFEKSLQTLLGAWVCRPHCVETPASALFWEERGVSRQPGNQVPTGPRQEPRDQAPQVPGSGNPGLVGKADTEGQRSCKRV